MHKVFDTVDNCYEKYIDLRHISSSELNVKARLVAKRFQEGNSDILNDSPTCSKKSMHLILNTNASSRWLCWSIDLKSAFLENKKNG